eukprot:9475186-Pyramimonas_sp.AAC.1
MSAGRAQSLRSETSEMELSGAVSLWMESRSRWHHATSHMQGTMQQHFARHNAILVKQRDGHRCSAPALSSAGTSTRACIEGRAQTNYDILQAIPICKLATKKRKAAETTRAH